MSFLRGTHAMLSDFKTLLRIAIFAIVAFYALPTLFLSASSYEEGWKERDRACFGNVRQMLKELDAAPKLPSVRTNWTQQQLFDVLKEVGRLEQLGLSDAEGKTLIKAFFDKMEIKTPASPPTSSRTLSPDENELFPCRSGTEFEPLDAVLLRWPSGILPWMNKWAEMVSALSEADVKVYMWVNGFSSLLGARLYLNLRQVPVEHVEWVLEPTDSVWIRDYGPQFVYDLSSDDWGVVDFHYYDQRPRDDDTPEFIAKRLGVPFINRQTVRVVYTEGGNLNHDGLGCVVYSRRTYRNNPDVPETVLDERILSAFQAHKSIVPQDPILDGTGHVDMFMKIDSPDTVLVGEYQPGRM
jgi:hypothetical protein